MRGVHFGLVGGLLNIPLWSIFGPGYFFLKLTEEDK